MIVSISLVVIAIFYAGLALIGVIGFIFLIKLYFDINKKVKEIKKELDPYVSISKDMLYKTQQMTDIAHSIAGEFQNVAEKLKDTSFNVLDTINDTTKDFSQLSVETKNKVKNHTDYIFDRVLSIEEHLDNIYAFLVGISKIVSKLKVNKKED